MFAYRLPWIEPRALFRRLQGRPYPFWLDSSLVSDAMGRFSFLGSDPFLLLRCRDGAVETVREGKVCPESRDPLTVLDGILKGHRTDPLPGEIPFCGGGVGFLGYDLGRLFERLPSRPPDDLSLPDMHVAFYGATAACDHAAKAVWVCGPMEGPARGLLAMAEGCGQGVRDCGETLESGGIGEGSFTPSLTRAAYMDAVRRVRDYIAAGDVFQVNLSQRFSTHAGVTAPDLYARLRRHSPAPFSAYLDIGNAQILSSSPERFLSLRGPGCKRVETRPIKGTRPRGATPEEDRRLAEELLHSEKDRAELVMIVDLERNDLGRVCSYGTVAVPELSALERYAGVFHTVATVTGELAEGRTLADLLRATFPGGSITGAPKVRAMEIIDELEPVSRGPYTGALGYFSFSGDVDLNILIRSLVVKGDRVCFHAGGGIVADSDPASEYEETLHKARGMLQALGREVGAR